LQLKDRHNGNVLIDNQGHIIHIDFGFMLSNSPGSVGFEGAPFKLTQEYVDVMGGVDSEAFALFRTLCKQAFQALRKSADNLVLLVELMGKGSRMPCFSSNAQYATSQLKQRFVLQMSEQEAGEFVDGLVQKSLGNYFTRMVGDPTPSFSSQSLKPDLLTRHAVVRPIPVSLARDLLIHLAPLIPIPP
jgi:phosphatidylinositol kinase/protein kinase (PI-3  family)